MTVMSHDIERELLQVVRRQPAPRAAEVLDFAQSLVTRDPVASAMDEQPLSDWDRQIEQIDQEQRAYERQHSKLLALHRGRYIAMRHGAVVDNDADKVALSRRIRQRYGKEPVLIKLVQTEPMETYYIRSPKLVRDEV